MRAYQACVAGLFSLCLFLSACGGGGGDEPTPVTPLPATVSVSSVTTADADVAVQFSSDVANPTGGLTFLWDFGDGASSTEASTSHQFAAAGDYEVKLTVRNEEGAEKSATFKITIGHFAMVKDRLCSGGEAQGWCWQRPLPSGNAIEDITFVDAMIGWAVGDAGQILKTTDGGSTWALQSSHVTARLTHVRFANVSTGWIVGDDGTVLRTTDAGATWERQAATTSYPRQPEEPGLVVLDGLRAVVMPSYYNPRTTVDGGATWSSPMLNPQWVSQGGTFWAHDSYGLRKAANLGADEPTVSFGTDNFSRYVQRFTMADEQRGLLLAYDWSSSTYQMHRTTNGGDSWQQINPSGLPAYGVDYLKLVDRTTAWAAAYGGLYRSTDIGSTWSNVSLPAGVDAVYSWAPIVAQDAQTLWFQRDNGFYLTTNAGSNWVWLRVEQELGSADKLRLNASGWWLQYGQRIYLSRDSGATWVRVFGGNAEEADHALNAVWFFDAKEGVAVGEGGVLLNTTNGGRDWTVQNLSGFDSYGGNRLQFVSRSVGWMSGPWGVSKTTDGGASWWTPVVNAGLSHVRTFHFADATKGWAVSDNGGLFRSTDGGNTWQSQDQQFWSANDIRFLNGETGFIVGDSGTVQRTEDGGATWRPRPTGVYQALNRVTFIDATTGWAVGDEGTVITSTDAGLNWSAVPVPSRQRLVDVTFVDPLHGWIVGEEGTMLATVDGGKTWAAQSSGFSSSLRSAFFLDAHTGWIVGADGAVLATATGGR